MLSLTEIGPGFYALRAKDFIVAEIPVTGLSTWEQGLRLIGVGENGRMVTDGVEDDTFAGCRWIFDGHLPRGFRFARSRDLPSFVFMTPRLDAVFYGAPAEMHWPVGEGAMPEYVIFREDDLCVCQPDLPLDKPYVFCRRDALLKAVGEGLTGIEFSLLTRRPYDGWEFDREGNHAPVRPARNLSRAEWEKLGQYVYIDVRKTAMEGVAPIVEASDEFRFEARNTSQLEGSGIEVAEVTAVLRDPVRLVPKSFVVRKPNKAGVLMPFLAAFPKDSAVQNITGDWPEGWVMVDARDAGALALPGNLGVRRDSTGMTFVLLHQNALSLSGDQPVLVVRGGTWQEPVKPFVLATDAGVTDALVSARRAATRFHGLSSIRGPFPVSVAGQILSGSYYFADDLARLPRKGAAEQAARERVLRQRYGDLLPDGWQKLADQEIETDVAWQKARASGWLTLNEAASLVGVHTRPAPNPTTGQRSLAEWLQKSLRVSIAAHRADPDLNLYPPFTLEQVVEHESFPELFDKLLGARALIFRKLVCDDEARAAVMLSAIAT